MIEFIRYAGRLFAAVILLGLGLLFLVFAFSGDNSKASCLGLAAAFAVAGAFTWPRRPNAWRNDSPTERQLAFARDLGIRVPRGISKGDLSDMISEAKAIRDAF